MRLATIRTGTGTTAVRLDQDAAVEIDARDVGTLLRDPDWRLRAAEADGIRHDLAALDYAPVVPHPEKIICVGLNYRHHIREMGREPPEHPTLFGKFPPALVGALDEIRLPAMSPTTDWEAELAVVVGAELRHATVEAAEQAIAGYTVANDVTVREWQYRTSQWLAGKTAEATCPLGPALVTADEARPGQLVCEVNGEVVQQASVEDLVFGPAALLAYVSTIVTLRPGDVLLTGTPGGVGHARTPPRYLRDGDVLVTRIEGVGECRNTCRLERLAGAP